MWHLAICSVFSLTPPPASGWALTSALEAKDFQGRMESCDQAWFPRFAPAPGSTEAGRWLWSMEHPLVPGPSGCRVTIQQSLKAHRARAANALIFSSFATCGVGSFFFWERKHRGRRYVAQSDLHSPELPGTCLTKASGLIIFKGGSPVLRRVLLIN